MVPNRIINVLHACPRHQRSVPRTEERRDRQCAGVPDEDEQVLDHQRDSWPFGADFIAAVQVLVHHNEQSHRDAPEADDHGGEQERPGVGRVRKYAS